MSCYRPLKAFRTPTGVVFQELRRHDIIGDIELPCGQCIGCRMDRAADWEMRCMHEASMWDENCFVTLTYARDCLPPNGSLEHRDFQLFLKRLRFHAGKRVRFYMCGEYGPLNGRPHYHACLFNVNFRSDRVVSGKSASGQIFYESAELTKLWSHGRASVQDLTRETAGYCARYIMKKALGASAKTAYKRVLPDGSEVELRPEYAAMSLKPGIGSMWFKKFGRDVFPHDFVVVDGKKRSAPKYYDKLFKRACAEKFEDVQFKRVQEALVHASDNTEERRIVREEVHLARVKDLNRSL